MEEKFFEDLKEKAKKYFEDEALGHGFDHTERVLGLALEISKGEDMDLDVIKVAAILHDIARNNASDEKDCHAKKGAEIARKILSKTKFPKEKIDGVCYAIKNHRYNPSINLSTDEAKIIQDADKLDALGAIAITRMFRYSGKSGVPVHNIKIPIRAEYISPSPSIVHHFYEKVVKLKPSTFKMKNSKKIARERYNFTKSFFDTLIKEMEEVA